MKKIVLLPGDGIGPEVVAQAEKILQHVIKNNGLKAEYSSCDIGGIAYENHGHPLPQSTLEAADNADALLLGAVGGPQWETILREHRPEQALLGIRSHLGLFSNLRPAMLYPELASASSLKSELVANLDIMIVRELTGGIYFGQPRGFDTSLTGERSGFNTMVYSESEIYRIAKSAFEIAMKRDKRLCSVDKANVLECSELWREVVTTVSKQYPEVELSHMYVDNAAMQLVKAPKQFDVIVTSNLFGDILSDIAAMLTGSIGMLPSASLDINGKGMYEPVHGSAPDIAGQNKANPLATILSLSMLLRYSLDEISIADAIDNAVLRFLQSGYRSFDIATAEDDSSKVLGCNEIGDKIISLMTQS